MAQNRGMWYSKPAVDNYHLGFLKFHPFMVLRMVHGIGFSTLPTNTIKHHQTPSTTKVLGIAISEPYNYRGMCQYLWDHGNLEWGTKIISSVRTCAYAYVRSFAVANVTARSVNRPILSPSPVIVFGIITRLFHGNDPNSPTNISDVLEIIWPPKTKQKHHLTIDFLRGNPRSNDLLNGLCFQGKSEPS